MQIEHASPEQKARLWIFTSVETIMKCVAEDLPEVQLEVFVGDMDAGVSMLLPKETGKTFSQLQLERRMERAVPLLQNTMLSIEEIAAMLGYSNSSNFYKAFKSYFHTSPRDYLS